MPSFQAARLTLSVILGPLLIGIAFGQPPKPEPGEKYALLVGVRKYRANSGLKELKYAEKDVTALAELLKQGGYRTVRLLTQADGSDDRSLPRSDNIRRELGLLLDNRKENHTVLVAFAGHGVQFKNEPDEAYFCPADAMLDDKKSLISLTQVYKQLEQCSAGCKLLLSDACRNDPVDTGGRSAEQIESVTKPQKIAPPGGVAALFSCSAGQRAYERDELGHGVFFHFVMEGLRTGKADVLELASFVNEKVYDYVSDKIGEKQTPELRGTLRLRMSLMMAVESRPPAPISAKPAVEVKKEITNSIGIKFVLIPAGEFDMGSPPNEEQRRGDEHLHHVKITKPFFMGMYEVTQEQYESVVGTNPSNFRGGELPVEQVSWTEAVAFCQKLSNHADEKRAGRNYRLPTEAEWEYACRAGTTTPFNLGSSLSTSQANFNGNYAYNAARGINREKTTKVGSFTPNKFGLYDMHGNVWEWCQDWYDPNYYKRSPVIDPPGPNNGTLRMLRGGSWAENGAGCRAAIRGTDPPDKRFVREGFRAVCFVAKSAEGSVGKQDTLEEDAEKHAAQKLRFAKQFLDEGRNSYAHEYFDEILRRWPKTKAAEEARGLLEKMKGK